MGKPLEEFAVDNSAVARQKVLGALADLLEKSRIDVSDIGVVNKITVGNYQSITKDDTGEAHIHDMEKSSIVFSPVWESGPEFPCVTQAAPTVVKHTATPAKKHSGTVTVLLPDPQIGYRRYEDGTLEPMHDEKAMDVAVQLVRAVRPEVVINLGDFIDASEWSSKFVVHPEFVLTTQPALDRGHRFLAQQRVAAGAETAMKLLGGNHDDRIAIAITRNAMAAMRLRQAGVPEGWPVLSIPFLLNLASLDVEYTGAYPAGRVKVAEAHGEQTPLIALHGQKLDMKKQATGARQSTVQGHSHHVAVHSETYEVDGKPQQVQSWSLGCLCRLDGHVPSTGGGSDEFGRPVPHIESWQHCVGIVTETDHGWWVESVMIHDGHAVWRDKEFNSTVDQNGEPV